MAVVELELSGVAHDPRVFIGYIDGNGYYYLFGQDVCGEFGEHVADTRPVEYPADVDVDREQCIKMSRALRFVYERERVQPRFYCAQLRIRAAEQTAHLSVERGGEHLVGYV